MTMQFFALAQWEQSCPKCTGPGATSSAPPVPCYICHDTGKVPMLPGLRKPCSCKRGLDWKANPTCVCGGLGWVLRDGSGTEDGRLLLFGALHQALLGSGLVEEVVITHTSSGFYAELRRPEGNRGSKWIAGYGPTDLEALVNAAVERLKEVQS